MAPYASERDPVSVWLDRGARQLLARAYAAGTGTWVMTRLADPSPDVEYRALAEWGIVLMGPDNAPTKSGKKADAHTRFGRAFTRSLYYNHRWFGDPERNGFRAERRTVPLGRALEVDWGRRVPARGIIPAGRAIRIRLRPGGKTARRVVMARAEVDRIYTDSGEEAGRHCVGAPGSGLREWE